MTTWSHGPGPLEHGLGCQSLIIYYLFFFLSLSFPLSLFPSGEKQLTITRISGNILHFSTHNHALEIRKVEFFFYKELSSLEKKTPY